MPATSPVPAPRDVNGPLICLPDHRSRRHRPALATVGTVDKDLLALACTFCGRSQREVRKLIAGPRVYICDACVDLTEGVASTGTAAGTQLGTVHAMSHGAGRAFIH